MTSTASLFACSASEVTAERVRELVRQDLPEGLTLEYKEAFTSKVVVCVAAMANTYGGIILVGVTDEAGEGRLIGVPDTAITQIVNACHDTLEPPWEPEVIPVPLDEGKWVLVVRVDPARAPRPLLIDGRAPVRLQGRNAFADRARLGHLFSDTASSPLQAAWRIPAPEVPRELDGSSKVDFVLGSGLLLPLGERAAYRPLSERSVQALAEVLNRSPLLHSLLRWSDLVGSEGSNPFHRQGHNRARRARLVWQAAIRDSVHYPIESTAQVILPDSYTGGSTLQFSLSISVAIRSLAEEFGLPAGTPPWRLRLSDLYDTMDAVLGALVDQAVVEALADLADLDPVIVAQPVNLDFLTVPTVSQLLVLDGLRSVPGAGDSYGAHLLADPALDLRAPTERRVQLDSWLVQLTLDGGLIGTEALLEQYHETVERQRH